jgi:SAM-dependent methyltransferase
VGCGRYAPFYRSLLQHTNYPERYVGVDLCPIKLPNVNQHWAHFCKMDITDYKQVSQLLHRYGAYDLVVASDILETMPHRNGRKLLKACKRLLATNGTLLLSTPVREKGNREVNDYSYSVSDLAWILAELGYKLVKRWGEAANYCDLQQTLELSCNDLLEPMRGYYSDDKLALLLSPLYPGKSTANIWVCKHEP